MILRAIIRSLRLLVSVVLAAVAGCVVFIAFDTDLAFAEGYGFEHGPFAHLTMALWFGMFGGLIAVANVAAPLAGAVIATEAMRLRSFAWHVPVAVALAFWAWRPLMDYIGEGEVVRVRSFSELPETLVAPLVMGGIVAGFVYWFLAGRHAGLWFESVKPTPPGA